MATAKVFRSGNSQAVRLPKQYRFNAKEWRSSGAATKSCCGKKAMQ
jgi:hypothetical protein